MLIQQLELKGYKRLLLNNIQYFKISPQNKLQLILGSNGAGKAQPLDSFIKIPNGWNLMGNLQVGDTVIAKDGSPSKVTGVFPQGIQDVYRFTFADGRTTEATLDHLWKIYVGGKKYPIVPSVMPTHKVIELLSSKKYNNLIWVDLVDPEQDDDIELPIDPYILGVMIGDGCLKGLAVITNPDHFITEKIINRLPSGMTISLRETQNKNCHTYGIINEIRSGPNSNPITNYLRLTGLLNKGSHEKFIPDIFLYASTKQRLELLQGLMDTDGTIGKNGTSSYSTTSYQLAEHVVYLVRSLGSIAFISNRYPHYTHKGEKRYGRGAYQINIRYKKPSELFTLPKKKDRTNDNNQYSPTLKLRIKSIEHVGQKECQCISIDHPDKLYVTDNFVVTHNTSVLKELSPLPANPAEFLKEGYKAIDIKHNGSLYSLKSIFSSTGNKFHFIKDEVELNPGGTTSVYRELVKKEFNITQDVHELMIGTTTFHMMSIAERRNWFTKISDSDFTFAIHYYQKLKEQLRDMQGGIKLNQSRLVQESEKLLTAEEEEKYRAEIVNLNELISLLLELKTPLNSNKVDIKTELNGYEAKLKDLSAKLISLRKQFLNLECFNSMSDVDLAIIEHQSQVNSIGYSTTDLCKRIEREQKTFDALQKSSIDSFSNVDTNIDELSTQINSLTKELRTSITFEDPGQALQALTTTYDSLTDIFTNLTENSDRHFSRDNYAKLLEDRKGLNSQLSQLESAHLQFIAKKNDQEHLKEHNKLECPKCSHVWSKDYDEKRYRQILADIIAITAKTTQFKETLAAKNELITSCEEYMTLQRSYVSITKSWSILSPLWKHIIDSGLLFDNPRQVIPLLESLKVDLQISIKIAELNKKLQENIKLKEILSKSQETDLEKISQNLSDLNSQLHDNTTKVKKHKAYVVKLNSYRDVVLKISNYEKQLEEIIKNRAIKGTELIDMVKREALNDTIKVVQLELTKKEQIISKINIQKALVENIDLQLKELNGKVEVLKIAVKELSPTEGLIAKGLTGFINHFVHQMNAFIKSIWMYPLELVPVAMNGDDSLDLDYKFSVKINDNVVISDINRASSAMKEVIDLAFKLISMQYLGLQDAPIYLDELSVNMDHAHRVATFNSINNLVTSSNFSQVFMISHYENCYGCLKNTDITVLCSNNIVLPKDTVFNSNVVIK